jgi:hypothetical protein
VKNSTTSPKQVAIRQKMARALRIGYTFVQIADELKISRTNAQK